MITSKAVLVNPSFASWSGQRQDKKVSREIEDSKGAKHGSGTYRKHLIDPEVPDLKAIREAISQARQYHYTMTLPWGDDGSRLLSTVAFTEYMAKMGAFKSRIEQHAESFVQNYPAYKAIAKSQLNGLYDESDYPTVESVRTKFGMRLKVNPVPDSNDLRIDIGADELARVRAMVEEETQKAVSSAIMDVLRRLKSCVDDMLSRLTAYAVDDKGKPQHPFRDSVVSNMQDLLEIVPKLNVTNDERINEITRQIRESLVAHSPQVLRDNHFTRQDVVARAAELSKALEIMGVTDSPEEN